MLMTGRQPSSSEDELFSLIEDDGSVAPDGRPPVLSEVDALRLFRALLQVRLVDERMMKLQRQGRLGFYMQSMGEEATHLAVHALRPSDWVFPSYREPGAAFYRAYSLKDFTNQLFSNAEDPIKGRQMPVHHFLVAAESRACEDQRLVLDRFGAPVRSFKAKGI